jgi:hypothetical protein
VRYLATLQSVNCGANWAEYCRVGDTEVDVIEVDLAPYLLTVALSVDDGYAHPAPSSYTITNTADSWKLTANISVASRRSVTQIDDTL